MRIAIAGISIEVMLNSPLLTEAAAIRHYDPNAAVKKLTGAQIVTGWLFMRIASISRTLSF
jgi:hypothetical protein